MRRLLKRITLFLLIAALILSGCGKAPETETTIPETLPVETTVPTETAAETVPPETQPERLSSTQFPFTISRTTPISSSVTEPWPPPAAPSPVLP